HAKPTGPSGSVGRVAWLPDEPADSAVRHEMTSTIRFLLLVILLVLTAAFPVANAGPTSAAPDYTVSVAPSATELPAGGEAVFAVSLSGQLASYRSFDYAVDGGTLVGVVAMKATGPASAE